MVYLPAPSLPSTFLGAGRENGAGCSAHTLTSVIAVLEREFRLRRSQGDQLQFN